MTAFHRIALIIALCLAAAGLSHADKIILSNGEERAGLLSDDPANPNMMIFEDHRGKIRLPKTALKQIVKEEPYQGYLAIADAYRQADNLDMAAEYYKRAGEHGAPAAAVDEGVARIRETREARSSEERKKALAKIDELMASGDELAAAKNFQKAKESYDAAAELQPSAEQAARLLKARIALHLAWGRDCMDRVDYVNAANHFSRVAELDPNNLEAQRRLIDSWKRNPARKKEVAAYYENESRLHPEDLNLRKEAGNAQFELGEYAAALPHLLAIHQQGKADSMGVKDRLAVCYQRLHTAAADNRDYKTALQIYRDYLSVFPEADPAPALNYEYAARREAIFAAYPDPKSAEHLDKIAELALWCRENRMDDKARKELDYILAIDPQHSLALQGKKHYASDSYNLALSRFNQKDYAGAIVQAEKTISEYADQSEITELAAELIEKSKTELDRLKEQKKSGATTIARQGDEQYSMALLYMDKHTSQDTRTDRTMINYYHMAVAAFDLAIKYWRQALNLDPELGGPSGMNLKQKIRDAEALKNSMRDRPIRDIRPPSR